MGCLPIVITLNWKGGFGDRGCIEAYNALSRDFNAKLQMELQYQRGRFAADGGQILYADIYDPLLNMILSPSKFGEYTTTEPPKTPFFYRIMCGCCTTAV